MPPPTTSSISNSMDEEEEEVQEKSSNDFLHLEDEDVDPVPKEDKPHLKRCCYKRCNRNRNQNYRTSLIVFATALVALAAAILSAYKFRNSDILENLISKFLRCNKSKPNPNTRFLVPASAFSLKILAEQEQECYEILHSCLKDWMHPSNSTDYTIGRYFAAVNQYIQDYQENAVFDDVPVDPESIAANPLASFRMIDRFVSILQLFRHPAFPCDDFHEFQMMMPRVVRWPTGEDVEENIRRILRLQIVYNLKTTDVAKGILAETATGITISPWQMYQFGLIALKHRHYALAVQWLKLTVEKLNTTNVKNTFQIVEESFNRAVEEHDRSWNNSMGTDSKFHFVTRLKPETSDILTFNDSSLDEKLTKREILPEKYRTEYKHIYNWEIRYWTVCSGEDYRSELVRSKLYCWLESKNHPTWTIRPLKMELLSSQPDVIQVYDILSDDTIKNVLSEAWPSMELSRVTDKLVANINHLSTSRTSMQAWLHDWYHPKLSYFSKTVERITGLKVASSSSSEKLQVLAYSFGGHYEAHIDPLKKPESYGNMGDRILTFMYYMSDVQSGGYTAFTHAGVAAKPVKGSGVFWFNLYKDGSPEDPGSQHGGCPVIIGRKYATNKWVRLYDQLNIRKCGLSPKISNRAKINGVLPDD